LHYITPTAAVSVPVTYQIQCTILHYQDKTLQCLLRKFIKHIGYKRYIGEEKSLVLTHASGAKLFQYVSTTRWRCMR